MTRALLEFVILTAARSGEARAMTWDEVDIDARVWTVPASRMKAKVVHRVPLSQRALEILSAQRAQHPETDLVFPSVRGLVLSDMVLTKFLRDHKAQAASRGASPPRTASAHRSAIGHRRTATLAISPSARWRTRSRTKWRPPTTVPTCWSSGAP